MNGEALLETERLRLRSWCREDCKPYHRACNTPAVMRWLGGVQTSAQLRADVDYFFKSESRDGITFWVVERLVDDAFLGFCGLIRIPVGKCPVAGELEIGWRIRADEWRKGYAFEAASAVLDYAFDRLNTARVLSRAAARNIASQQLMEKLGMKRCPHLNYLAPGETSPLVAYLINASSRRENVQTALFALTMPGARNDAAC